MISLDGDPAPAIDDACRRVGFFVVRDHGADLDALADLDRHARAFFARPVEEKAAVAMPTGGRAWRGWFPAGGELTSGVPDGKEGYYFGADHGPDHPRVVEGVPLHGANRYLPEDDTLRSAVDAWMAEATAVGQRVLEAMAVGLGLAPSWFAEHLTADPTVLFRIFRYPPPGEVPDAGWGVAEHTDYGLLTILATDGTPGLQVRTPDGWADVPDVSGGLVVNLGDMLERLTAGRYRSTPHRVVPPTGGDRLSFPLFLDPGWDVEVTAIPGIEGGRGWTAAERWDGTPVVDGRGRYGDYLVGKVMAVFPELAARVLAD